MGRGKGGSTSHEKRTPGGIRTSSKMSQVGEIEAKHGVLGEERAALTSKQATEWEAKSAEFKAKIEQHHKDRRAQMLEFWNKYMKQVKQGRSLEEPDPGVLLNDIERWMLASKRKDKNIKPLSDHANHVELHEAMANYLTADEEKAKAADAGDKGVKPLYRDGKYSADTVLSADGLMKMAQGTSWCTKNKQIAKEKVDAYNYTIVSREGKPLFAIKEPKRGEKMEILYKTDFSLTDGQAYLLAEGETTQPMHKDDYAYLQEVLKRKNLPPLKDSFVTLVDDAGRQGLLEDATNALSVRRAEFLFTSLGPEHLSPDQIRSMIPYSPMAAKGYLRSVHKQNVDLLKLIGGNKDLLRAYVEGLSERAPDIEPIISQDKGLSMLYVTNLHTRYPGKDVEKVESYFSKNVGDILEYAGATNSRFEAGEALLAQEGSIDEIIEYMKVIGHRYPRAHRAKVENKVLGEDGLEEAPWEAMDYYAIAEKDMSEAEKNAFKERLKLFPEAAMAYAKNIEHGRVPELEGVIAKDARALVNYMRNNNLDEYPQEHLAEARKTLVDTGNVDYIMSYVRQTKQRFPEGEAAIFSGNSSDPLAAGKYLQFLHTMWRDKLTDKDYADIEKKFKGRHSRAVLQYLELFPQRRKALELLSLA